MTLKKIPLQPLQFMNNNELEPLDDLSKELFQLWTKILVSLPMRDSCSHLIKKDLVKWANKNFQEFRLDFSPESFRISPAMIDFIFELDLSREIPNRVGKKIDSRDIDTYTPMLEKALEDKYRQLLIPPITPPMRKKLVDVKKKNVKKKLVDIKKKKLVEDTSKEFNHEKLAEFLEKQKLKDLEKELKQQKVNKRLDRYLERERKESVVEESFLIINVKTKKIKSKPPIHQTYADLGIKILSAIKTENSSVVIVKYEGVVYKWEKGLTPINNDLEKKLNDGIKEINFIKLNFNSI